MSEYVGFLTTEADSATNPRDTQSYITGEMAITADFERGAVSGEMFNRQRFLTASNTPVGTMADVSFRELTINGSGSGGGGQTSGGQLTEPGLNPGGLTGEWNIAFGGDNAAEAGGTILIDHDYVNNAATPDDYVETGGFVVTKN